ncbi:uncharacterized protein CEXT_550281 [Caerostris extrusa]|uniref:Gem-associated protein 2 n=1 Tax=Caerostris extrusa TaxID=172846 RepID=A0AAV4W2H8_CAEEX|nr:uncharacterized protein CEXT_550281 [Caerostris extrusa]
MWRQRSFNQIPFFSSYPVKKMNIEIGDEEFKLIQKGFYVEEPNRCITLNTIPKDGNEFVHLERLQAARDSHITESQALAKRKVSEFNILRKKFHADKDKLKIEFPKKIEVPEDSEEEWCKFCLGSELSSAIYKHKNSCSTSDNLIEGHLPLLSIVLHLSQETLLLLLQYHYSWFLKIGMHDDLCRWMFAMFVCLEKSFNEECKEVLEAFCSDCQKHLRNCDKAELNQTVFISLIISSIFL